MQNIQYNFMQLNNFVNFFKQGRSQEDVGTYPSIPKFLSTQNIKIVILSFVQLNSVSNMIQIEGYKKGRKY